MLGKLLIFGCIIARTIQFCPQPCDCNDHLLSVSCSIQKHQSASSLDQIPIFLNPQVKSLDLQGNDIFDIGPSLQFYGQLLHLDISRNRLSALGESNFENLKNLRHLNMSNNQLTLLTNWSFKGLSNLLILDLSANQLEIIDEHAFNNLSRLEYINLSHNRLTFMDWTIFHGLTHLDNILLEHNFIQDYINKDFTWTLDKVSRLDLQFNRLKSHISFDPFTNIKRIDLAFNRIDKLHENLFDYNNIQWLNLSNNALAEVPSLLTKLSELSVIDLSSNHISFIQSSSFQNLFKLTFIDLSYNPISFIHSNALLDNINLVTFKLDHSNQLKYFDMNLLHSKPFLKLVSLKYCQLTHIDSMNVETLENFELDIIGNPWHCNCSTVDILHYLEQYRQNQNENITSTTKHHNHHQLYQLNVICSTPIKLHGVPVSHLDMSNFEDCFISDHFFTNTVFLGTGLVLFIIIVVLGIKVYRVYKSKPDHHHHHRQTADIIVGRTFDSSCLQYDPHGFDKQVPSILV